MRAACACVLALYGLAVCAQTDAPPNETENAIALRVNTHAIGVRQVEAVFADSYELIRERVGRGELKPAQVPEELRKSWKEALQTVIQDTLLDDLAARHRDEIKRRIVMQYHPSTPHSRIEDAYRRWESDHVRHMAAEMVKAAGGEEALIATLRKKGQTYRQWQDGLVLELWRRSALSYSMGPVVLSPAAGKAYFEQHPKEFHTPGAWRLRRIRIPKDRFGSPEDARKAAQLVHQQLSEGQDFAQLAAALQYDPQHDKRGGLMTVDGKTDLPPGNFPLEERIAKDLKDGQFSAPVETAEAWLIVKRELHRPEKRQTWEDASERANALAYLDRVAAEKREFFEKQKNEAYLETLIEEPPERWLRP